MGIKNIIKGLIPKSEKNNKIKSDDSYCYSTIVWNTKDNLIILLSFSEDYFGQIIELQDAMNYTWQGLRSKIVYSSYDEETNKVDDKGYKIWIIHNKYYLLIGGSPLAWEELYMNIHNLGNEALARITSEITNNCCSTDFNHLIDDGILYGFKYDCVEAKYDNNAILDTNETKIYYTNPVTLMNRLPNGFTARDILKFINIKHGNLEYNGLKPIIDIKNASENTFKNSLAYNMYKPLFKDISVKKLSMLLEPLYKQPDDDSIPGDVDDESLDSIFREHYERFSATSDDSIHYEDIDEELEDDEESENMRPEDIIE